MSLATPRKGYKSVPWLFGKEIEIPDEWKLEQLEKFSNITMGMSPPSESYNENQEGLPFYQGIADFGENYPNTTMWCSDPKKIAEKDQILFSVRAPVGETNITNEQSCLGRGVCSINPLDNELMYCYFLISYFKKQFVVYAQGTTYDAINRNEIARTKLPFTSNKNEQQKIANILSNVDNLIESTGKVITHSKKVKKGLMQKLLTRGIGHTKFKKVAWLFGKEIEIPEEWEIVIIKKLVTFHKQGLYTTQPYSKNGIKIARVNDLENPNLSYDKMNNLELDPKTFDSFKISKGDFLIARTGNIGNYGIVTEDIECVHISDIIRFNFNLNELLNEYFGLFFESHLLLVQLLMIQQSSSHIHINAETMKSLKIPLPPLPEQQKIASILSNIDSKITSQEQYKEKLEKLKKSLMQKLLTGEVRV